ncbi:MAG TPA: phosphotransferase family protein [Methylomirabilota bacterium]|jgi:aminoglycoside phosphotransferase (APT) family kinase protein
MSDAQAVAATLGTVVAARIGPPGEVRNVTRLTGGATKITWSFDARVGDGVEPLILQQSSPRVSTPGDPMASLPRVSGADEAALLGAAANAGVPVAAVRATLAPSDGLGVGLVTDRIEGETLGARIARDERFAAIRPLLAGQCGRILAALHRIDVAAAPFLAEQGPAAQVRLYREVYESFDHPRPAMEIALRWVAAHAPTTAPTAIVHGDFRNGNFVVGADGIRAVLDWEIAHLGDPMEDLGWLCVKTWRFGGAAPVGGFGAREALFAAYEGAGGVVDAARVRFWEAFGCVKWSIMCMMKGESGRRGGRHDLEQLAIGRRAEEPLWDFLDLVHGRRG